MPLLNYTTKIEASTTVGKIQALLAKNGARSILCQYDDQGFIVALSFVIQLNDISMEIRLPSDWRPVLAVMEDDKNVRTSFCTQDQALKVSWRIIEDWVKAQMAILETRMVKIDQIFLPYAVANNGQTLYENVLSNPQILLN